MSGKEIQADQYASLKEGIPVKVVTHKYKASSACRAEDPWLGPDTHFGRLLYAYTYVHVVYADDGKKVIRREKRPLRVGITPMATTHRPFRLNPESEPEMLELFSTHFECSSFRMYMVEAEHA